MKHTVATAMSKRWSSRGILFAYIQFSCDPVIRLKGGYSKADLIPDRLRSCEPHLKCLLSGAEEGEYKEVEFTEQQTSLGLRRPKKRRSILDTCKSGHLGKRIQIDNRL